MPVESVLIIRTLIPRHFDKCAKSNNDGVLRECGLLHNVFPLPVHLLFELRVPCDFSVCWLDD